MAEGTPTDWPFNATAERRFWPKVNRRGPDECWLWTARRTYDDYGQFRTGGSGSPNLHAHAVAWMLTHGHRPPKGLLVRHTCDVRACCNPAHLLLGTHQDNARDRTSRGRQRVADGNRRLTDTECVEIVRRYLAGEKQCDLAAEFGTVQTAVSSLAYGLQRPYLNLHDPDALKARLRIERVERARAMTRQRVASRKVATDQLGLVV